MCVSLCLKRRSRPSLVHLLKQCLMRLPRFPAGPFSCNEVPVWSDSHSPPVLWYWLGCIICVVFLPLLSLFYILGTWNLDLGPHLKWLLNSSTGIFPGSKLDDNSNLLRLTMAASFCLLNASGFNSRNLKNRFSRKFAKPLSANTYWLIS